MLRRALAAAALLCLSCGANTSVRPRDTRAVVGLGPRVTEVTEPVISRPAAEPKKGTPIVEAIGPERSVSPDWSARLDELDQLTDEQLGLQLDEDIGAVGSMSLGKPNAGALLNGVTMPEGEHWEVVAPRGSWATQETIDYLIAAVEQVNERFPGAHKLYIGHLSRERGGPMRPHASHQSGRDADLSYYYLPKKAAWYQIAHARTLDIERSWALVRALLTETDVEMMFIDLRVQKLLKEHALAIGEDPEWLDSVFRYRSRNPRPIIRHRWGHASHIHVRFYNPYAQELGRRAYDYLVERQVISPRYRYVKVRAKGGDTYASLAQRAGTSVTTLRKLNGSRSPAAGRLLVVPVRGQVAKVDKADVPARQAQPLPPLLQSPVTGLSAPAAGRASP